MIQLTYTDGSHGDVLQKAEEYLANVEAYVVTEGQNVFGAAKVDGWLRRLEEASCQVCEEPAASDNFVAGISRSQKYVRIEPKGDLTKDKVEALAKTHTLQIKVQSDGKLVVYGCAQNLKAFLKQVTSEKPKI